MKVETVIKDVVMQPTKIQPIIVNFSNGKLKNEEATKVKCNLFYDEAKDKTVLGLANNQVVYKGYRPDPKEESVYTMLAIHNKKTGKVRLIQAERWNVAPVLNDKLDDNIAMEGDRVAMLNKQFGSKKVKRRTEQHERMQVNIESVKEQLEKTAANANIEQSDLELKIADPLAISNLPPCNRDASSPEDVYDLNDIIPMEKLEKLCEKVHEIRNGDLKGKSKFYIQTLNALENTSRSEKKIAILEYIDGICKWLNTNVREFKKRKDHICPVDSDIGEFIMDSYSMKSSSGRTRPMSMRDKAIIHCLILGLMINNYKLDIELFADHVKSRLGRKKMLDLSRIVGATPSKDNKNLILLKTPLPPPPNLVKRGKRT